MEFAQRLRYFRQAAGLTQEQLAHKLGWPGQSRIGNYESTGDGGREPSIADLVAIAKALGIPVGPLADKDEFEAFNRSSGAQAIREARLLGRFRIADDRGKYMIESASAAATVIPPAHDSEDRGAA